MKIGEFINLAEIEGKFIDFVEIGGNAICIIGFKGDGRPCWFIQLLLLSTATVKIGSLGLSTDFIIKRAQFCYSNLV